jgi:hypothetical protein
MGVQKRVNCKSKKHESKVLKSTEEICVNGYKITVDQYNKDFNTNNFAYLATIEGKATKYIVCNCSERVIRVRNRIIPFLKRHKYCKPSEDNNTLFERSPKIGCPKRGLEFYNNMFSKVGVQFTRIEGTIAYDQTIVLSCCDLQLSTRHLDRLSNAVSQHHCNNRGLVQFNEIQNVESYDDDTLYNSTDIVTHNYTTKPSICSENISTITSSSAQVLEVTQAILLKEVIRLEERNKRIDSIKPNLPTEGKWMKFDDLFDVPKDFFEALVKNKVNAYISKWLQDNNRNAISSNNSLDDDLRAIRQAHNISSTTSKISNYVGGKGHRIMIDSSYLMKSKYHFLEPMHPILEFLENLTWIDNKKRVQKYGLHFNMIYNEDISIAQKAHTDYKEENGLHDPDKELPFTIFLGIYPDSKLIVWNGTEYETIDYGAGDVLFLAGDVIHAGPTYLGRHGRMQLYAQTNVMHNKGNPNEWYHKWCFNQQPLAYELDNNVFDAKMFNDLISKNAFNKTYKTRKDEIVAQLRRNEENPSNKERFFSREHA